MGQVHPSALPACSGLPLKCGIVRQPDAQPTEGWAQEAWECAEEMECDRAMLWDFLSHLTRELRQSGAGPELASAASKAVVSLSMDEPRAPGCPALPPLSTADVGASADSTKRSRLRTRCLLRLLPTLRAVAAPEAEPRPPPLTPHSARELHGAPQSPVRKASRDGGPPPPPPLGSPISSSASPSLPSARPAQAATGKFRGRVPRSVTMYAKHPRGSTIDFRRPPRAGSIRGYASLTPPDTRARSPMRPPLSPDSLLLRCAPQSRRVEGSDAAAAFNSTLLAGVKPPAILTVRSVGTSSGSEKSESRVTAPSAAVH